STGRVETEDRAEAIVVGSLQLPSQAVIQGQARVDFPLILRIQAPHGSTKVARACGNRARRGLRNTQQEIRIRHAGVGSGEVIRTVDAIGEGVATELVAQRIESE